MTGRLLAALCAAAALALAGAVASATGGSTQDPQPPSRAELNRVQASIDWKRLAREGIYVKSTGQANGCVSVSLANPTPANIAYVRGQYGPYVCVDAGPAGPAYACTGYMQPRIPKGRVTVPNVRDLGVREATRRLVARGLTFATWCRGQAGRRPMRPARHSPEALLRITQQCPRPGQRVPRGTEVALGGSAPLPGGFDYRVSTLGAYHTGGERACGDRRHVTPPGTG